MMTVYAVESCVPWKAGGFRVVARSTAYRYPRVGLVLPAEIAAGTQVTLEIGPQGTLDFQVHRPGPAPDPDEGEVVFGALELQEPPQGPPAAEGPPDP